MAHYNLAVVYAGRGKVDDAIAHLRQALASGWINANMAAMSHYSLGECLAKQGNTDEALAHFEEAVRVFPKDATYHARLAIALALASKPDRAILEWRQAIRIVPTDSRARLDLANFLLAQGDADQAAAECREILELQPDSTEAMVILGTALTGQGKAEEAIALFEHALTLDPQNAVAHFSLGLALLDRGQSHGALAQFNEATRLQPDNPRMLVQTAWMLATHPDATIRDGERAAGLARRAVERSGGQDARAFDALAAALAESEKFPAAIEAADHASALALAANNLPLADAIEQRRAPLSPGLALSRAGATADCQVAASPSAAGVRPMVLRSVPFFAPVLTPLRHPRRSSAPDTWRPPSSPDKTRRSRPATARATRWAASPATAVARRAAREPG